jgi:hypothetical protein
MAYNIQLCRKEVMQKHKNLKDGHIFEDETSLLPFTEENKSYLINRLLKYGYLVQNEGSKGVELSHTEGGINCLLTNYVLHFSSTFDKSFDIMMTSSEFTDTEEFVKFDPQNGGWEEN